MRRRETILDELLVLDCQSGDRKSLERLVERWQPRLMRLARRLTQSDEAGKAVQEAWLAIVRGLGRLDGPARFRTWAYRIVAFPPGTVKSRLFHARKRLRASLEDAS